MAATKHKQPSIKSAVVKTLDQLVREYLLLISVPACFTCGVRPVYTKELQVGHFVSRMVMMLRWDLRNIKLQCNHCNVVLGGNLDEYAQRLDYSEEGLSSTLKRIKREVNKLTMSDLFTMVEDFKKLIKEVKAPFNPSLN